MCKMLFVLQTEIVKFKWLNLGLFLFLKSKQTLKEMKITH